MPNVKKYTCRLLLLIINYMANYLLAFSFLTALFLSSTSRDKSSLSNSLKTGDHFLPRECFLITNPCAYLRQEVFQLYI